MIMMKHRKTKNEKHEQKTPEGDEPKKKYPIVSIFYSAFKKNQNIKSVQFSPNSELKSIDTKSFSKSSLEFI